MVVVSMVNAPKVIEELQAIVGGEFVQAMTSLDAYRVDGRVPWAVVIPGDINQLAAVLALAHREELAIVPWGGGTTMAMGHPPERLDLVLSLARLNRVLEHEPADLTASVQAGITMDALQAQLEAVGNGGPSIRLYPLQQRSGECWHPMPVDLSACCTAQRVTCSSALPWYTPMAGSRKLGGRSPRTSPAMI